MRLSESNPLLRGMAANPPAEHPDADLLTAFREGSLLERERQTVMSHLAVCPECRAVLNLSAVEEEQVAPKLKPVPAASIAAERAFRPRLRLWVPWGAIAAAMATVAVFTVRHMPPPDQAPVTPPKQMAEMKPSPAVSAPLNQAPLPQLQSAARKKVAPGPNQSVRTTKDETLGGVAGSLEADQRDSKVATNSQAPEGQSQQFYQPPTQTMQRFGLSQAKSEAEAQRQMRSLRQADSEENKRLAQTVPASGKPTPTPQVPALAKSVTAGALLDAPASSIARPNWRINDQGRLERSFANGAWKTVLADEPAKMHVLSITNGQVWVGGENDRVYRSKDDGTTWQSVTLPQKDGSGHVIVHIRFESAQNGTIQAADGTTWTTGNGGATWN